MYKLKFFIYLFLIFINIFSNGLKLKPGIIYKNKKTDNLSIHTLYLDPKKAKITIGKSNSIKAQKTSEIAFQENSIAAINGGYFDFGHISKIKKLFIIFKDLIGFNNYNAYPVSTLKINNSWYSLTEYFNSALAWKNNNKKIKAIIDSVDIKFSIKIGDLVYLINSLNKPNCNGICLYNKNFGQFTPFKLHSLDIKIQNNTIVNLKQNGHSKIDNSFILSIPLQDIKKIKNYKNKFNIGQKVTIKEVYSNNNFDWNSFDCIVAGFPILVKNGQLTKEVLESKSEFFTDKHPRTAIGILPNGNLLLIVIDGRQKFSEGISLIDLAKYMIKYGCQEAINLDGGGSSTMVINNKIVNSPSGRSYSLYNGPSAERPISNAILVS